MGMSPNVITAASAATTITGGRHGVVRHGVGGRHADAPSVVVAAVVMATLVRRAGPSLLRRVSRRDRAALTYRRGAWVPPGPPGPCGEFDPAGRASTNFIFLGEHAVGRTDERSGRARRPT